MSILDSLGGRRLASDLRVFALAAIVTMTSPVVSAAETAKKTEPSQPEATQKVEASQADIEQQLEAARKRLDAAAREVADLSMKLSGNVMTEVMPFPGMGPPKAVLGINLGGRGDKERSDGVEVVSVSPGGGAAQAGLKAGDVLVEVNGKALKS